MIELLFVIYLPWWWAPWQVVLAVAIPTAFVIAPPLLRRTRFELEARDGH